MSCPDDRSVPVTVNDVLDGHAALDLQCLDLQCLDLQGLDLQGLDRLYLHGYLARRQVGGQVISGVRRTGAASGTRTGRG
jgi:hypothetical protein